MTNLTDTLRARGVEAKWSGLMASNPLLLVTILFCCVVGFKLSTEPASLAKMAVFVIAAIFALQISYVIGLLIDAFRG